MLLNLVLGITLFLLVFHIGRTSGRIEARLQLQQTLLLNLQLYNRVIRLAELKGENVKDLTTDEIVRRMSSLAAVDQEK